MTARKSNVNPDHYKIAGRERQGENIVHNLEKQKVRRIPGARKGKPLAFRKRSKSGRRRPRGRE